MNRFAGLSVLAVTLVAAGTLLAQDTGSAEVKAAEQAPVAAEKPVTTTTEQPQVGQEASVTKQPGDTHVRIVRLSQVQGKVGMDRGTGHGVEASMQNMPIIEGMLLGTADEDSYAEVEFEDGSTIRLGPGTAVKFMQLVTRASGAKATTVRVDRGTVFVSREHTKPDEFMLLAGETEKLTVTPATHMRLELLGTKMALAVFSGDVAVEGTGAPMTVGKKQTLSLDIADKSSQPQLAKKVEDGPFDGWDKDAQQYHERYAKANSLLGGGNGYGISDLNYYGAFSTVDGCGTFWQPYFVGAGWSPYANGLWAQYPGAGYSWVSPYPWGWLPFHSGAWCFSPSRGWGWQPGGSWVGLNNIAASSIRGTPAHMPGGILPTPPADARESLVLSNRGPLVMSKQESPESFVFHQNSAGMGVPRGSLGNLNDLSNHVAQHGSANSQVYTAPAGESTHWNDGAVYHGPLSLRRGSAPDEARQAMWARQQQAAAEISAQPDHHHTGGISAAPTDRHGSPQAGQTGAPGWQGHQAGNANTSGNSNHSWNNNSSGAANSGHTWNGGGASSGQGHSWSGGPGAGSAGPSHPGGGSGQMNNGGGGHSSSSAGSSGTSGAGANPASSTSGGSHK
jgi:ferric-dicitrate binding protein FerR (iron transport regulator)